MKQDRILSYLEDIDKLSDSVYVLHEKLEQNFPFHNHKKGQLTYVEGGIAYLNTEDKAYFLPARHYVWIPAGMDHFVQHKNLSLIVRNIYFPDSHLSSDPFYSRFGIYPISNLLLEMLLYTRDWKGPVLPGNSQYQFLTTLLNILPDISVHPLPIALPTSDNDKMAPIIRYIQQNLSAPLTLDSVASEFALSVRSLSRLFQSTMDISFLQYLKMSRMVRAVEMLLQSDKSITEIAYDTGYTSISAFSNTFYQLLHVRPSDFVRG